MLRHITPISDCTDLTSSNFCISVRQSDSNTGSAIPSWWPLASLKPELCWKDLCHLMFPILRDLLCCRKDTFAILISSYHSKIGSASLQNTSICIDFYLSCTWLVSSNPTESLALPPLPLSSVVAGSRARKSLLCRLFLPLGASSH
ncbi:unnamed protein product [Linum trigynum]|uniref:Uncharacterized protein n=1 Tax=Linum trigynum TaxID=586398 RepID=A0AAV2CG97_9ROSI